MKVLFDQNVPRNLRSHLIGHDVATAANMGWELLKNGDLLAAAESKKFEVLVTGDRSLEHQQNFAGRNIAIVVLTRNNWPLVKPHVTKVIEAVATSFAGSYRTVDCSPTQ